VHSQRGDHEACPDDDLKARDVYSSSLYTCSAR